MPFITGLSMTAAMIVALGPQNIFLIRYGLAKDRRVFKVAGLFVLIDLTLITIGSMGVGTMIASNEMLRVVFSVLAAAFFAAYGLASLRNAFRHKKPTNLSGTNAAQAGVAAAVAVSVINPGVLMDTIVLVGGLAGQFIEKTDRIAFAFGAVMASFLWFFALSAVTYCAARFITGDGVWKWLDLSVGVLMLVLGGFIAHESYPAVVAYISQF
ncbi:MAG: LysE family transporter [Alphaproteobacteria bacterium]|nr:LysE family transporter [Alphaproteobacteria bacterium]